MARVEQFSNDDTLVDGNHSDHGDAFQQQQLVQCDGDGHVHQQQGDVQGDDGGGDASCDGHGECRDGGGDHGIHEDAHEDDGDDDDGHDGGDRGDGHGNHGDDSHLPLDLSTMAYALTALVQLN